MKKALIILTSVILISALSATIVRADTISDIQAKIAAISAQIESLLKEILALQGGATGCSSLWWIDNADTKCLSQKKFCGTYMYQGLQTFSTQHDCLNAAAEKKAACVPNWKCDWGACMNGYKSQVPVDLNSCGIPVTQASIACPFSTQQCATQSTINFTLISALANITEYSIDNYIATGTVTFKVKLSTGVMQQFTGVSGALDKTKPMVVINAYDSDGKAITAGTSYRYITQTPSKDLIGGEEATIIAQQTINYSSKSQIKPMRFKIDYVNYGLNSVLETYGDTGSWYTNLASLPAISRYSGFQASIAEAIRNLTRIVSQMGK